MTVTASAASSEVRNGLPALLPRLWRYALVISGDREVARELVQEACARAIEREAQFAPGTRLDRWLFSILSSVWKNQLRAAAVRRGNGLLDAADVLVDHVGDDVEHALTLRRLLEAVGALPEAQRSAVVLVYVEGYTYKEAASALEITIGALVGRLAAAKTALGHVLSVEGNAILSEGEAI